MYSANVPLATLPEVQEPDLLFRTERKLLLLSPDAAAYSVHAAMRWMDCCSNSASSALFVLSAEYYSQTALYSHSKGAVKGLYTLAEYLYYFA